MSTRAAALGGKTPTGVNRQARRLSVLVVDDEQHVLLTTRQLLESLQFNVLLAQSTTEALKIVGSARIDAALIDWRLSGSDDGLALGRALTRDWGIPFVLFSGYLTTDATVYSLRQGAADVLDKPLRPRRLSGALQLAVRQRPSGSPESAVVVNCGSDSVARRWATLVLSACRAAKDPHSELEVATASAVSTSVFCKICDACDVGARDTRDFARFLRAEARSREDGSMLRTHLAASDPRTRTRLFERAGLSIDARFVPLRTFVLNQQFIPCTMECLRELAHLAANDPMFFVEFSEDDSI